jgi:two-component sensor histidine kinase
MRHVQMALHKTPGRNGIRNRKEAGLLDEHRFEEYLLLQELTHRINNELASTVGFVSLTAAQSGNDEVKLALAGVIQHIHDFAGIYRALQMPAAADQWVDAAKYLGGLCRTISRAKLQHRDIELTFLESPLQLNPERCWRLGMIVSELITNASRHAFHGSGGKIQIELLNCGATVECSVTDNGCGSENSRPGQGSKIIRSLAQSLGGNIEVRFGARGTIAIVSFPLVETEPDHIEGNRLELSGTRSRQQDQ